MRLGICGWSQSGKTTVFDALSGTTAKVGDHSEKTHIGMAKVHDDRLDFLATVFKPKKVTYATVEYVDLPALVAGTRAHEVNPKTLGDVRQADALIAVVRAFENASVPHPFDTIDPARDFRNLWDELVFADFEVCDRRIKRLEVDITKPTDHQKDDIAQLACLRRVRVALEEGKGVSSVHTTEPEERALRGFRFLTVKPIIVLVNRGEEDTARPCPSTDANFGYPTIPMFAKLEMELAELAAEDRETFMKDLGLKELATPTVVRKCYEILDQISFLTAGDKEVRAWTIRRGTHAVEAAGTIHTDIERGFIRAEVTAYEDFKILGSFKEARAKGKLRLEGKDYVVKDGDIVEFRFSV